MVRVGGAGPIGAGVVVLLPKRWGLDKGKRNIKLLSGGRNNENFCNISLATMHF